jgi:hypothetical protein
LAIALWVFCGTLSVLARREHPVLGHASFQLASVAVYVALGAGVAGTFIQLGHPLVTVPGFVLVLIAGVVLGLPYFAFLVSEGMDRLHAAATGIDQMTVRKTFDRAEKAEREGDLDGALARYREEADRDPRDPEPVRRMAEIDLRAGRVTAALDEFRQALSLLERGEAQVVLSFRLSELLEKEGAGEEARRLLERVEQEYPGTRFAEYAQERLRKHAPESP